MTKAIVYHTGDILWQPPAIYKSSCVIDVEYFPYDIQTCLLKLGSWTYDGVQVTKAIIGSTTTNTFIFLHRPRTLAPLVLNKKSRHNFPNNILKTLKGVLVVK